MPARGVRAWIRTHSRLPLPNPAAAWRSARKRPPPGITDQEHLILPATHIQACTGCTRAGLFLCAVTAAIARHALNAVVPAPAPAQSSPGRKPQTMPQAPAAHLLRPNDSDDRASTPDAAAKCPRIAVQPPRGPGHLLTGHFLRSLAPETLTHRRKANPPPRRFLGGLD